jgi:hypothetical protein
MATSTRLSLTAIFAVGIATILIPVTTTAAPQGSASEDVTFNKDVLSVLQDNCQTCHRPGEMAPMSFMSYEDTRPWARAIRQAVITGEMPPWFAEEGTRHFLNDRSLGDADMRTLVSWVDNGAPEGDVADMPEPREFEDGWNLKPDLIVEMPIDFQIPAEGTVNYQNVKVKVNFPEDTWIIAAEMRAGNSRAVHHMRANVIPPDSTFMQDAEYGVAYENGDPRLGGRDPRVDLLGKYNPGLGAQDFAVFESAKFVPKGSDIVFNLHYTAIGEATTDRSKVGLVFANEAPKKRYYVNNGPTAGNLAIPAGDRNAEVVSELTTTEPMELVYLQPHMHLRGTDMEFQLIFPTGERETIFKADWNFDWQLGYELEEPIALPVGTRMVVIAHYDNSANNPFNPDPTELVVWGPQNWHEMQNCFIGVLIDPGVDETTVFRASGPSLLPRGVSGPTLASLD